MKLHLPKKMLQSTSPSLQAGAMRIGKGGRNELTCQLVNLLTCQLAFYRRRKSIEATHLSILDLCMYQFHLNHPPLGQTPGTRLEGSKNPPPGQPLCTKSLPSGQNRESKAPPPGQKVRKFQECIHKL